MSRNMSENVLEEKATTKKRSEKADPTDLPDLSLSSQHFQATYLASLLKKQFHGLFCNSKTTEESTEYDKKQAEFVADYNRRTSEAKIELSTTQNGSAFRRVQPKDRVPEPIGLDPDLGLTKESLQLAANLSAIVGLEHNLQKLAPLKRRLLHNASDSSVPQSPVSLPRESPLPTAAELEPESGVAPPNATDDEKLKKQKSDGSPEINKQSAPSPLPIKKRRYHGTITPNPIASPQPTSSKLSSKKTLKHVRKENENLRTKTSRLRLRLQDYITRADVKDTLDRFVQSQSTTPSDIEQNESEPESEQSISEVSSKSTPGRMRRVISTVPALDEDELQQLAPFMGLSGSEKSAESDSASSSDSEYGTKNLTSPSGKIRASERKKKSQENYQKKQKSKARPQESVKPIMKIEKPKTKTKKSLDNVLSDLISAKANDPTLAKFFEADQELDKPKIKALKPSVDMAKKSRKPSKPQKLETQKLDTRRLVTQKIETQKIETQKIETQKINNQKVEPQKIETQKINSQKIEHQNIETQNIETQKKESQKMKSDSDDENNWEPSENTVVDKNSSLGEEYLIKEDDASWYSVTCFCGSPFAGRPMIECDRCSMWVHMNCGKVRKNKVPEKYICPLCKRGEASSSRTRR